MANEGPPYWKTAVKTSHLYHGEQLSQKQRDIIDSYRADIDSDDWPNAPLILSFQLINWAIKKINKNNNAKRGMVPTKQNYRPALLTESGLRESGINRETLISQVKHAKELDETLHTFPRLGKNMTVYRGESCNSFYYEKAANMEIGEELVLLPFLSTSINPHVATRFTSRNQTKACRWEVTIPSGQIFPYVSEVPEELDEESAEQSEQEVLLPTHAHLRLRDKLIDQIPKVYRFELIGFKEKSADFWDNTLDNLLETLPKTKKSKIKKLNSRSRTIQKKRRSPNGTKKRKHT